jgi:hypothetical protein
MIGVGIQENRRQKADEPGAGVRWEAVRLLTKAAMVRSGTNFSSRLLTYATEIERLVGMKKVIDASGLRSPELSSYLSASTANLAVLSDYAAMESFKGSAAVNIRNALRIVSRHPKQVLVLKSTGKIASLRPRRTGLHARLIDHRQTAGFPSYCRAILDGAASVEDVNYDIVLKELAADGHFATLAADTEVIRTGMVVLFQSYPPDDLKSLRAGRQISGAFSDRVVDDILRITARSFRHSTAGADMPSTDDAMFSFQFRYALCSYVLALKWAADGGYETAHASKLRNDFTDATYAAYATFFDGLITKDKKLQEVYRLSVWLLRNIFSVT